MKGSSLSLRQRFLRWSVVLVFVIASIALLPQPAQASQSAENHCITPLGDLNQIYGISEQIVTVFCPQVNSGAYWVAAGGPPWFMNTSFELVPEGFVPAGETPLEDFRAKFVAVKYMIDPGTLQEQTYIFPTSDKLWTGPHPIVGLPAVHPITLGTLRPLSVGEHVVQVYWVFSAMHCDGLGDVIEIFCLGPGEIAYGPPATFKVLPGAAQSQ